MNHFFQSSLVNLSVTQRGNSEACFLNKGSVLTASGTNYTEAGSGQDDPPLDVPSSLSMTSSTGQSPHQSHSLRPLPFLRDRTI